MKNPPDQPSDPKLRHAPPAPKSSDASGAKDELPTAEGPRAGAKESPASRETFPERTRVPGDVGLANESRPGLGTRGQDDDAAATRAEEPMDRADTEGKPRVTRRTYEEPRPEPREQAPDSLQHEEERSSGVSGHSGGS